MLPKMRLVCPALWISQLYNLATDSSDKARARIAKGQRRKLHNIGAFDKLAWDQLTNMSCNIEFAPDTEGLGKSQNQNTFTRR